MGFSFCVPPMKPHRLALPLLLSCTPLAAHPPTMLLMGGSYQTCSSLDDDDCRADQRDFPGARQQPLYRIDSAVFDDILDAGYWAARPSAPAAERIAGLLRRAQEQAKGASLDAERLGEVLESADPDTWNRLLTLERDLILSAFELPQFDARGKRRVEGVRLDGDRTGHDATLFRRFVAEAAKRSPGKRPRIAFVTSASNDSFYYVDLNVGLLEQAGAEVVWWPVDAAMNAAVNRGRGCDALIPLRRELLSQLGRERVYPDLHARQAAACHDPEALAAVPEQVQGLFFDGGDQWLHRETFFDADGRPNRWLRALRAAFARGELVVSGTSAGAAIQSGPGGMVTNGLSTNALTNGAIAVRGSMPEGCERARRCPIPLREDDLTWWHGGGFGLLGDYLVDTHVAERRRELRLITLMSDIATAPDVAPLQAGIGVDETSGLLLQRQDGGLQLEALGQSGAWWFERPSPRTAVGGWSLRGHYLAPGATLFWRDGRMQAPDASMPTDMRTAEIRPGSDALQPKVLRTAVWDMAGGNHAHTQLQALDFRLQVRLTPESRVWQGPQGQQGVTALELQFSPGTEAD